MMQIDTPADRSRRRILDGRKLALARAERGLRQADLAELVGTTQAEISRYENDRTGCRPQRLKQFAKALRVRAKQLMPDADAA